MTRFLLALDQGTTSSRAIIFNIDGEILGIGQKEFDQHYPEPGWVEHDPVEIKESQAQCIKDALQSAGIKSNDVAAVGISNQRETTVVWNRETGKPIHNAIVWQCRRTSRLAEKLTQEAQVREKTGLIPDAYFSGPKIQWLLNNISGARKLADSGKLAFGTIDTWLLNQLTSEKYHYTEPSNASRTLLYDINSGNWDDELLGLMEVPRSMMPQVVPSDSEFGSLHKDICGIEAPVLAVLGDQQSALFGQACFLEGMTKCTYGTGSFFLTNIGSKPRLADGLLTTVAWHLAGSSPVYAFEGAIFITGAAIQWLRDGLGIIESSDEVEELAKSLPDNEGVYFVPALAGLGSPWWNSEVRGTIVGLTRGTNRAHLVRAATEAMAYQVADAILGIEKEGIIVPELKVDGGATRNQFMLQFQADLLAKPVLRSSQLESTAWGVAALAGLRAGLIESPESISSRWKADLAIMPGGQRVKEYQGWQKALRGTFAQAGAV